MSMCTQLIRDSRNSSENFFMIYMLASSLKANINTERNQPAINIKHFPINKLINYENEIFLLSSMQRENSDIPEKNH